jgi:transcriptional regulator with XRE-family HTH domain
MTKTRDKAKTDKVRDFSISAIASQAGVDKSHVSMIFSGKRMPSLPVAVRVAKAMGITVDDLCERLSA